MISTKKRLRLCAGLIVCNLIFIWGNSLLPGSVSGAISDGVKTLLSGLLPPSEAGLDGGHLVRKLAHFTEFAVLGALLGWLFAMLGKGPLPAFAWGVAAACADETIQRFVPDRGPGLGDVALDSCGVAAGLVLLFLGHTLWRRWHGRKAVHPRRQSPDSSQDD